MAFSFLSGEVKLCMNKKKKFVIAAIMAVLVFSSAEIVLAQNSGTKNEKKADRYSVRKCQQNQGWWSRRYCRENQVPTPAPVPTPTPTPTPAPVPTPTPTP